MRAGINQQLLPADVALSSHNQRNLLADRDNEHETDRSRSRRCVRAVRVSTDDSIPSVEHTCGTAASHNPTVSGRHNQP